MGWNGSLVCSVVCLKLFRTSLVCATGILGCDHKNLRVLILEVIFIVLWTRLAVRLTYVQRLLSRSELRTHSSQPYNLHIFIFRHHQQLSIKCNLQPKKWAFKLYALLFLNIPSSDASQLGEYRSMLPLHKNRDTSDDRWVIKHFPIVTHEYLPFSRTKHHRKHCTCPLYWRCHALWSPLIRS